MFSILDDNFCNPKFSVIIPVYNTEKYLDEAVKSVLSQTETDYEILLIDDGSTDNSGVNCDKWALIDNRIKVYHQKNMGQMAARECGLNNAIGKYTIFLDSDDLIDCDALKAIDEEFINSKADCVIYGYRKLEDGVITPGRVDKEKLITSDVNAIYQKILGEPAYNSMCRKVFRRELISDYDNRDYYHLRHGEDLIQSLILLYRCKTVVFLNRVFYTYRMLSTSISHNIDITDFSACFGARETVYNLLKQYDKISDETITYYKQQCIKHFVGVIISILDNKTTHIAKEKIKEMRYLPWYKTIVSTEKDLIVLNNKERLVMWLFKNGHLNVLLWLFMCLRIIRHH